MDFIERLTSRINAIDELPLNITMGYLLATESFVIYPMPGSQITQTYMDGTTDQRLNYELAMKSKSQKKVMDTLWIVQNELERLEELDSNSFEFRQITVTDKPFINQIDEQGWFVFLLNIQARITVLKGDN